MEPRVQCIECGMLAYREHGDWSLRCAAPWINGDNTTPDHQPGISELPLCARRNAYLSEIESDTLDILVKDIHPCDDYIKYIYAFRTPKEHLEMLSLQIAQSAKEESAKAARDSAAALQAIAEMTDAFNHWKVTREQESQPAQKATMSISWWSMVASLAAAAVALVALFK